MSKWNYSVPAYMVACLDEFPYSADYRYCISLWRMRFVIGDGSYENFLDCIGHLKLDDEVEVEDVLSTFSYSWESTDTLHKVEQILCKNFEMQCIEKNGLCLEKVE